ncbi:MAG TPA: hypothetical protein VGI81_02880 [Tepidisphaeraceae bacterium]|jgi:hypothetical protein
MIRHLFTLASVVSFLACLTTCALWVRSYSTGDEWFWMDHADGSEHDHINKIEVGNGKLAVLRFRSTWMGRGVWHFHSRGMDPSYFPPARRALGFYWFDGPRKGLRGAMLPLWALVAATAAAPVCQIIRWQWKRTRHWPSGSCAICDYDLRASTDRCPECGTPIIAETKA